MTFPGRLAAVLSLFVVFCAPAVFAANGVWRETDASALRLRFEPRGVRPASYRTFALDVAAMKALLKSAPREFSADSFARELTIELPMPDGTLARFRVERSPVAEAGLLEKYPELGETFRAAGVDDPAATARLDFLPQGFHAIVLSPAGTVLVEPYFAAGDVENYISYTKADAPRTGDFRCEFESQKSLGDALDPRAMLDESLLPSLGPKVASGTQLRTYRLAVAATNEYAVAVGGNTIAGTLAAQVLIMNRVNGVYERDLAMRMVMIANNDLLLYAGDRLCGGVACTAANDPYTNSSGTTMLGENQANIDTVIGSANYDIGHVFSTGGGGVASLRVPCTASKARGVTGLGNPVGDAFAIDYVAHEMGHQWGGNHTFNGAVSNCGGGNRSSTAAFEPGSGVTIMAYAGICGNQDLELHSIDTFHVRSLEEIVAYSQTGNGNSCASTTATGNTPPAVSVVGGTSFNIPKQTPFALTASATDDNGDQITYDWEEYSLGAATTDVPNTDASGARPVLRPYPPTTSPRRTFPSMQYVLANANVPPATWNCNNRATPCLVGELLPQIGRTINFQVVARDNRAGGGGINTATATVIVDGNSGPFAVTAPNAAATFPGGAATTVTWNVASTTNAPVSAANVRITLSADGGQTFPTVLAASTANDGTESVVLPNLATTQARVRVEAVGNIFFDVSDANFSLSRSSAPRRWLDFDGDAKTDVAVFRPAGAEWWRLNSSNGQNLAVAFGLASDVLVPADFTGDGKTDYAFFRPSTGDWYVLRSDDGSYYSFPFGASGDVPAPGDFDGDGKADAAVFRPSSGTWFILKSSGGTTIQPFGVSTDRPLVADYDGDGRDDIAVYRPSSSQFWLLRSTAGLVAATFGAAGDKAVPGDFTGDGKADVAVFRPTTGTWFVLRSEDNSFFAFPFGASGDVAAPGDYDGDGKFDAAVFRPSTNTWFINRSTAGVAITPFGATGDAPVPNAFVR